MITFVLYINCYLTNIVSPFSGLESLVEPLRATCTMKVKANSVKQEYEKQDELKRSALRAAAALLQIPEAGKLICDCDHTTPLLLDG